ncbi:MAG TPA: N-formylglutamate amidohydrolase [Caulobacter sp.]|nr:N-formylglutamate amidohydrolase [Caulobacter sp.]
MQNPGARSPYLLVGDHAGVAIPRTLGDLGLPPEAFLRHIAVDIGICGLGPLLADRLGACFISQHYSRLVIDCNRDPARADAIAEVSDGTDIPANLGLTPADRQARIEAIFQPYHARIATELDWRAAQGLPTVMIALHSFTPVMRAFARPWRYGVLHLPGSAFSDAALAALREAFGDDLVGDNEPYRMDDIDFTVPHHAIARGLDYLELEVRQDLLETPEGQAEVAAAIAPVLERLVPKA